MNARTRRLTKTSSSSHHLVNSGDVTGDFYRSFTSILFCPSASLGKMTAKGCLVIWVVLLVCAVKDVIVVETDGCPGEDSSCATSSDHSGNFFFSV